MEVTASSGNEMDKLEVGLNRIARVAQNVLR